MSLQHEFESCLASLDSPVLIHLNHTSFRPRSPSPSLKSVVVGSSRPRSDSLRKPYARSPLGDLSSADNLPTRPRSSSRASIVIGHESRHSVRRISNSFQALPPILSGSSVHFRSNLDFNFQSFMISSTNNAKPRSRRHSRLSDCPPALPPLPSLSQPLFPAPSSPQKEPFPSTALRNLRHPNSPYVPWDSPMRREIFRPLTPESSDSLSSPSECSRSGAVAPEPTERNHKIVNVSRGIKKVHRTVKHIAKRMFGWQKQVDDLSSSVPPHLVIDIHADNTLQLPAYPPSPGVASFDSSNTRSLALWLDTRRQAALEWEVESHNLMSLEDYERRGSWINVNGGKPFVCSLPGCTIHSRQSRISAALMSLDTGAESCMISGDAPDSYDFEETAVFDNLSTSEAIEP